MQFHDDGEKELDDLVSTWSLGGIGEMEFRIKQSHAHPFLDEKTYKPMDEVVMGSDFWKERSNLNALYKNGLMDLYKEEKANFFAENGAAIKKRRNNVVPWCLRLKLHHGDFVVMHGAKIHTSYEVSHCGRHKIYRAGR